jgi:hypothetical protein
MAKGEGRIWRVVCAFGSCRLLGEGGLDLLLCLYFGRLPRFLRQQVLDQAWHVVDGKEKAEVTPRSNVVLFCRCVYTFENYN